MQGTEQCCTRPSGMYTLAIDQRGCHRFAPFWHSATSVCLDMTGQWYSPLVVPTMCGNSRHPYEHDTIVCVCPIRLAHHDHTPPRQRIDRHQHYSIFRHHKKGHDSVQSPFHTMNGVNILNMLPIPCRSSVILPYIGVGPTGP